MMAFGGSMVWHQPLSLFEGQRLIANDLDPLLGGLFDVVNGSVVSAFHIADVRGSAAYIRGLGLDFAGSPFEPTEPLSSSRFEVSCAVIVEATDGPSAWPIGKTGSAHVCYAMTPYMARTGKLETHGRLANGEVTDIYDLVNPLHARAEDVHGTDEADGSSVDAAASAQRRHADDATTAQSGGTEPAKVQV